MSEEDPIKPGTQTEEDEQDAEPRTMKSAELPPAEPGTFRRINVPVVVPGSWREMGESASGESTAGQPREAKKADPNDEQFQPDIAKPDSDLGRAAGMYAAQFGSPRRVIYPGCGSHVIDGIFPDAEIVYVDPAEFSVAVLLKKVSARSRAVISGIEDYTDDERFDLLFSLNSHADMQQQLRQVKQGGHVFCNNYFGTKDAEKVIKSCECDLVAVINKEESGPVMETEPDALAPYTEYVESGDERFNIPRRKVALYYVFRKK